MDEELDVVVTEFDVELRQAEAGLERMFGLDAQRARRLLRELPIVARRNASHATAERYVAALRSIGARVELRPTDLAQAGLGPDSGPSLPEPLSSAMTSLHESLRIDREADSAIARFRASEGLDTLEHFEGGLDLANPSIPKAPAIPHDLAHMPNAALPHFSDRPGWGVSDPTGLGQGGGIESAEPRPHTDAQRPMAAFVASPAREQSTTQPQGDLNPARPGAIGLAHAAVASGRPGLGSLSTWPRANDDQRKRTRWPFALGAGVLLVLALWLSGVLGSTEVRRLDAWRRQGIEAGDHAPAAQWLRGANHEVEGIGKDAAQELVGRLSRAGARAIFAIQIHQRDLGARASGLLVELPDDANVRRTIFWYAARQRGPNVPPEADHGQRYHLLSFR